MTKPEPPKEHLPENLETWLKEDTFPIGFIRPDKVVVTKADGIINIRQGTKEPVILSIDDARHMAAELLVLCGVR